jgi:hypothetical protein
LHHVTLAVVRRRRVGKNNNFHSWREQTIFMTRS